MGADGTTVCERTDRRPGRGHRHADCQGVAVGDQAGANIALWLCRHRTLIQVNVASGAMQDAANPHRAR
jgi:hypothetical protein